MGGSRKGHGGAPLKFLGDRLVYFSPPYIDPSDLLKYTYEKGLYNS